MLSTVMVDVLVPAAGEVLNVSIPYQRPLYEVAEMLRGVAGDLGGSYSPSQDAALCDSVSGLIFNMDMTAEEVGLSHGSTLIFV